MTGTPAQRRAALDARYPTWEPKAIHEWFLANARRCPERDFVVTDDGAITYAGMAALVERLAKGLVARGVTAGDRVAVLIANHPEYVVAKYALSRLGAVMVPLNYMFRRDELAYVLRQSEAGGLLTMTGFRGTDYLEMLDGIAPGWTGGGMRPELPDLRFVAQFETEIPARDGVPTLDDLGADGEAAVLPVHGADPDDAAIIFYTSGTTGPPKGVVWTHDIDARIGIGGALSRAFGDGWRVQSALPLYHAFANNEVLNATMFAGGAVIPRLVFDADDFLDAVGRHRPHEIVTVPTMVVALCESPRVRTARTDSVVALMSAGAIAPVRLWERAVELLGVSEVTTGYGMTETGGGQVMSRPEDGIEHVSTTVGRIKYAGAAGVPELGGGLAEMRTVDPSTGEPLPDGAEGEIVSRGPTNALGYWKRPAETAETFRGEWVHSGDLGRILSDGAVVLTGRKKELIRSGGENYSPKEVEDLLTGHPRIAQAFVVGVPDDRWGEIACAWVVPEPGAKVSVDEVDALCREHLAGFKRPRTVRFIDADALPTTPTGKVQKFALVEMAARQEES